MAKLKAVCGYFVAVMAIVFMLYAFVGMERLEKIVVETGLHPAYWYSGGVEAWHVRRDGYLLIVNKPVFRKLFGSSREGFVQFSLKGLPSLPAVADEHIIVAGHSFTVTVDTVNLTAKILKSDGEADDVDWVCRFDDGSVVVRIALKNRY